MNQNIWRIEVTVIILSRGFNAFSVFFKWKWEHSDYISKQIRRKINKIKLDKYVIREFINLIRLDLYHENWNLFC